MPAASGARGGREGGGSSRKAPAPRIAAAMAAAALAAATMAVATMAVATMSCGGSAKGAGAAGPVVPERAATAGDALLALVPAGAQVVIELDLDRARGNAVIGPLARALLAQISGQAAGQTAGAAAGAPARSPLDELAATPLATAHAVVVASYHVGSAEAASLTLVRGEGDAAKQAAAFGAVAIGDDVLALGPPDLVGQAELLGALPAASISRSISGSTSTSTGTSAAHAELLALRARPMPSAATGAILRVTAELSFDARLSLARQTRLDAPPARLALWADAVDDAAIVLLADSRDEEAEAAGSAKARKARQDQAAERLSAALRGALGELARDPRVAALGLGPVLRGAELERAGSWIKVAIVVGPQRLQRAVQRASLWTAARPADPIPPSAVPPSAVPPSIPEESP